MKLLMDVLCASMVGGLSVIVFSVIFRLCRNRFSAKYRKIGWILIALCLILPLNLDIFPRVYTVEIPELVIREQDETAMMGSMTSDESTYEIEEQSTQRTQKPMKSEITTTTVIMLFWFFWALLLTLYYGIGYQVLNRRNKRWSSECRDEKIINTALRIAGEYNLKKVPEIRMMDDSDKGPFTIGLLKKVIYLPREDLFENDIEYVLKHEMTHCKEHDLFWKIFFVGVNIVHWFNPLVWMLRKLMDQDMEVVCDETVVQSATREERQEYGNVIMAWVERSQSGHQKNVFATSYVSGSRFLKRRFDSIFDENNKKQGNVLIGATVLVLVFFSCMIRVEAGTKLYLPSKIPIDSGIEIRTDVDGDGEVEKVRVTDNVSGDYAFTQVSVIFNNGDVDFINYDEDFYASNLIVGDLSGNGAADIVVMKYSRGSTFGGGDVSVLHASDGRLEEYPCNFIKDPSLDIELPDGFGLEEWWVSWVGATIIERDGKTLLRLLKPEDVVQGTVICIDCSYRENGWYIESAEKILDDVYATGMIDELLENRY